MAQSPGHYSRDQAHTSAASATHIYTREAKAQPLTAPAVKITAAFGLRECPKVVELLAHEDLDVRQQALLVLCEVFGRPDRIATALRAGAVPDLLRLASDPDETCRVRASLALSKLAEDANGKEALLSGGACAACVVCLRDACAAVRANGYTTLVVLSRSVRGVDAVCEADAVISLLCDKAKEETDEDVRGLALKLLYQVLGQRSGEALREAQRCGAVNVSTELLGSSVASVREGAAATLCKLTFNEAGKQFAIKADCVRALCGLLGDKYWRVRSNAAAALMSIAIDDAGKNATIEAGGVPGLIKLLRDRERLVKISAMKAIATVSAHPAAREMFMASKPCVDALTAVAADADDEVLSRNARIAKEVVEWKP